MNFITNRILITIITLLVVSALSFGAFHLIPGDAAIMALGIEADEAQIAALRSEWGLDRSIPAQYAAWLTKFLTGNLGNSVRFRGAAISGMIKERLPVSACLALLSLGFVFLIAAPIAMLPAWKKNSPVDLGINTFTAINISMPGFFLGVLFIWIFGLVLKIFIPGAYVDYRDDFGRFIIYLVFPAIAIALPNAAILIKFLRSSIYREWNKAYVTTARSKGAGRRYTLKKHVLKNASLPALTILGMIIGEVFSGSIIMEQVFSIPGLGRLLIAAITSRDYLLVETLVIYIAFVVIIANTLVDIAIQIIDPRIQLGINTEKKP